MHALGLIGSFVIQDSINHTIEDFQQKADAKSSYYSIYYGGICKTGFGLYIAVVDRTTSKKRKRTVNTSIRMQMQ